MEKYYTVDEVAAITGLTSRTIRTYIAEGKLTGMRLGRQWRFSEDDIAALYTVKGGSARLKGALFKGEAEKTVEEFLSSEHSSPAVCVIADCAGLTDAQTGELYAQLGELCAASGDTRVTREGGRLVFSGTAAQTLKLLKAIKKAL